MDVPEQDKANLIRDRAIRLFDFLKELAQLKSATVKDLAAYDEVVWFHPVPEYKGCFSILSPESDRLQDSTWLEIRKCPEPKRPQVPSLCLQWLEDDTDSDLLAEPRLKDEIPAPDSGFSLQSQEPSYSAPPIRLADHSEILQEWEHYIRDSWVPWSEVYSRWKAINETYFKLFSIHKQIEKLGERYELLIGLGLLTWETPNNQIIRRHVVVGDAYLTFDAARAKFEVQGAPEGVKLRFETEMIDQRYLPSLGEQMGLEELLSSVQESPWSSKNEVDEVLRSFVNLISPHGIYSDSLCPPDKRTKEPMVTFAPAIILRTRTQRSQIQCLNNIIKRITDGGDIPSGVEILCKEKERGENSDEDSETASTEFMDENLYLPLPTNEEQKQIIYQIRHQNGILVQGPPGTGKSHTIANIICHLLAEGKRVLVTSQTPRALRVLKKKIPEEIQALCVILLGNDQAARQELEDSVYGINLRYSEWNQLRSERSIIELEECLYRVKNEKAETETRLRELQEIDAYRHTVANGVYQGTAQQIGQRVAREESTFGWLEDNISGDKAPPLSTAEFGKLLRLYRELPEDYCSELRKELVNCQSLPDVSRFVEIIDEERKAHDAMTAFDSRRGSLRYRTIQQLPESDIKHLHEAISGLLTARDNIKSRFSWIQQAVLDILADNDAPWNNLHAFIVGHLGSLEEKLAVAQTLDVKFPEYVDRVKLKADALDLLHHLEAGGRMGWKLLAPKVVRQNRYITDEIRVNGRVCRTTEQLDLLVTYLGAMDEVDLLWSAFKGKDNKEEGSLLLQVGYLRDRLEALEEVLNLKSYLVAVKESLKASAGLAEPQWNNLQDSEEMILDIQAAESDYAFNRVTSTLEQAVQKVRVVQSSPKSHDLNRDILAALDERDTQAFAQCLEKLESLERGCAALREREALSERLRVAVPKLERQLQNTFKDDVWDGRVANFELAWAWKVADSWLREFGQQHNEIALEASLKQLTSEEQKAISILSAEKAWGNCLRRLTPFQRANLIAWATAMRRMPKTSTAKTRPKWLKQAQECMDNCRGAIPAWVMPLYRVFETIPPAPECFDVVIIDEASQTGPEGLVLQYLAKQIIIVGDSQQISPDAIGLTTEEIDTLVKRYLAGIPFKDFYDPATSLFAFADILFSGKIVLREHFRCMPEIIQFSNQLCYAGTPLKPLRQYPPNRLDPILLRYVKNGRREGPTHNVVNPPEADALVESIIEVCSSKAYSGKTIGVISLQGEAQAKRIEHELLKRLSPSDLESRKIVCGDAYAFQGDERDVMFLSMVAAPDGRIAVLNRQADMRRFNVAASRARDQVVLFHSVTLNDLHPDCMRHKLLEYYLNPTRQVHEVDLTKCNQFERDVCQAIMSKGYEVIPQYKVAGYYIDLMVEGVKSRLAVECDGDEWHGIEQYEKDAARQRILERAGLRFWRIRGYDYYRDPVGSLEPLWRTLAEVAIMPKGASAEDAYIEEEGIPNALESNMQPEWAVQLTDTLDSARRGEGKTEIADYGKEHPEEEPGRQPRRPIDSISRVSESKIYNYPADYFFSLAHWAKENRRLESWERNLAFNVGKYIQHGWQITQRMEHQSLRIIREAVKAGFSEGKSKA